jgi:hypothetical protein
MGDARKRFNRIHTNGQTFLVPITSRRRARFCSGLYNPDSLRGGVAFHISGLHD